MNNLEIMFIILLIILIFFMSDISNYLKESKYLHIELFQNSSQTEEEQDNNTMDEEGGNNDVSYEQIGDEEEIGISTKNTDTHTSITSSETETPLANYTKTSNGFELLSSNFDGNINLYSPRVNKQL